MGWDWCRAGGAGMRASQQLRWKASSGDQVLTTRATLGGGRWASRKAWRCGGGANRGRAGPLCPGGRARGRERARQGCNARQQGGGRSGGRSARLRRRCCGGGLWRRRRAWQAGGLLQMAAPLGCSRACKRDRRRQGGLDESMGGCCTRFCIGSANSSPKEPHGRWSSMAALTLARAEPGAHARLAGSPCKAAACSPATAAAVQTASSHRAAVRALVIVQQIPAHARWLAGRG